jgi:peptidoglycan/LPS O-acetylase OafA/YrhL
MILVSHSLHAANPRFLQGTKLAPGLFFSGLSYSISIWQHIFYSTPETFGLGHVWWMSFPGWVIPAIGLGFFSFYYLEQPLSKLRARFRDYNLSGSLRPTQLRTESTKRYAEH